MPHRLSRWLPRSLRARLRVAQLEDRTVPAAPTAAADNFWTPADTPLTVAAPGVLDNDADSDPIRAEVGVGPWNGSLALNPTGSFTYTPAAGSG